jgi:hypothetical protein
MIFHSLRFQTLAKAFSRLLIEIIVRAIESKCESAGTGERCGD